MVIVFLSEQEAESQKPHQKSIIEKAICNLSQIRREKFDESFIFLYTWSWTESWMRTLN